MPTNSTTQTPSTPEPLLVDQVRDAVRRLNDNYGRGDVRLVRVYMDGRIEFVTQSPQMQPQLHRGRLVNSRTVKALGHQLTFDRPGATTRA